MCNKFKSKFESCVGSLEANVELKCELVAEN